MYLEGYFGAVFHFVT